MGIHDEEPRRRRGPSKCPHARSYPAHPGRGAWALELGTRRQAPSSIRSSLAYGPASRGTTRAPLGGPRPRSPQATGTQDSHERRRQARHRSDKNREGSRRTVKLTRDATDAPRGHLTRQLEEIDGLGDLFEDNGFVFCTAKGTLINPSNLRKRSFAPLLVRAGLPHMTFHQLRHTAATILLLKNVNPKIVSEMLGHASIAITLDTYSHVLPNMQDSAVAAMEEAFS
jgi:integrase